MQDEKRKLEAKVMILEEEMNLMKEQNLPDLAKLNKKMSKLEGQFKKISTKKDSLSGNKRKPDENAGKTIPLNKLNIRSQ